MSRQDDDLLESLQSKIAAAFAFYLLFVGMRGIGKAMTSYAPVAIVGALLSLYFGFFIWSFDDEMSAVFCAFCYTLMLTSVGFQPLIMITIIYFPLSYFLEPMWILIILGILFFFLNIVFAEENHISTAIFNICVFVTAIFLFNVDPKEEAGLLRIAQKSRIALRDFQLEVPSSHSSKLLPEEFLKDAENSIVALGKSLEGNPVDTQLRLIAKEQKNKMKELK